MEKIVIIGAGTAGTIMANRLYRKLKKKKIENTITVIDPHFQHVYQPGFLFTMTGVEKTKNLIKDSRKLMPKQVIKLMDSVEFIDTTNQKVKTVGGETIDYDYIVIGSGVNIDTKKVDWWDDSIHHFYTPPAAEELWESMQKFKEEVKNLPAGEKRSLVVSISDLPYKCPPAPLECAMLFDDMMKKEGLRDRVDITYTAPLPRAFSIETVNSRVQPYMEEKSINIETMFNVEEVDTQERVIYSMEGDELEYDFLIMTPPHRGQDFVTKSGIAEGAGWIPTDKETLQVRGQHHMYALGDATDIPTSKAGSTAHHQAPTVVDNIVAEIEGKTPDFKYDGHVQCFFLTQFGKSIFVDFDYGRPPKPSPTRKIWWWFKLVFKPLYFATVARGLP